MKRIVSLLLIVTMLLTMAVALSACTTEKIIYVTESKEDKDDDAKTESATGNSSESGAEEFENGQAFEVCAISAATFTAYYENKGVTVRNPDRNPSVKIGGTEVELDFEDNAEEAMRDFWDAVGRAFESAADGTDVKVYYFASEEFVCVAWQEREAYRTAAILVSGNMVLRYGGYDESYEDIISTLVALGALKEKN